VCDAAVLLALCLHSALVTNSRLMLQAPQLIGSAVLLDLVLTSAFCHLWLGVRWGRLPVWTAVPVAAGGLALSRWLLPADVVNIGLLPLATAIAVEGAALVLMVTRIRTVAGGFRDARRSGADRFSAFESGLLELGRHAAPLARWVRLELEVWFFFAFGWFMRPRVARGNIGFSHHDEAGWSAVATVLVGLVVVEGALAHLWLEHAGFSVASWLVSAFHLYGLVWITGDALALRVKRTCMIPRQNGCDAAIDLQLGIRARAHVPLASIAEIERGTWDTPAAGEALVHVLGPANVRLRFTHPVRLAAMLSAPRDVTALLLQVDDAERFARVLKEHGAGAPEQRTLRECLGR
jgi:hypothetical protein